jgi:protease-4
MTYFRAVSATVTGILVFFLGVLGAAYYQWGREPGVTKGSILQVHLGGAMLEYPPGGFTTGLLVSESPTLHTVLDNLSKAAVDRRVTGVLFVLDGPAAGYGMLEELRAGIRKVRDAGKPVWAWSDNLTLKDLYIAAACDSFFIHPSGYIYLGGMYADRMYLAGTLEKLGIEPQLARIESYKSAAELMMRKDMSPQDREMMGWILGDIYPRVLEETASGLGVGSVDLERAMERALLTPEDLVSRGLADGMRQWDEMKGALPRPKGKDKPIFLASADYDGIRADKVGLKGKHKIAVVHAQGMIGGDESGMDPLFGITMGQASVNRDLQKALDDDDVIGVVFRVDSRGGESITSDRISRMVEIVDREKPVVASMVDVAASGGYNISYRARKILADGHTITGSIGSITGKFTLRDFYNRLGVTKDGLGQGPNADFYSDYRKWSDEEYARLVEDHWAGYNTWVRDIARFRKLEPAAVDSVGRGRVWTGRQAKERKLVDGLGTLDDAVAAVKEAAGLDADEKVTLVHYPQPEGILASILGMEITAIPEMLAVRWTRAQVDRWGSWSRAEFRILDVPLP